jgi:Tfp pilus assembly protein PilF
MRLYASGLALICCLLTAPALAVPLNEQPMFGNQPKTPAMLAADQKLITDAARFGSRAETSDRNVALGWQYFSQKQDIATAMKRFNQAWLLDPDNGDSFHGFAIMVMERDQDEKAADDLFRQGIAKPRQSPGIWLDYGRFLIKTRRPADAIAPLRKAITFPRMGPDAQALLAMSLFQSGDAAAACAEAAKVAEGAQPPLREVVTKIRQICRS